MIPAAYATSNVTGILAGIVADQAWSRVPILLDALQDAEADEDTMRTVLMWWACAGPLNDEPRLLWADSVGGERGEFVKIQVELEGSPPLTNMRRISELRRRERELLTTYEHKDQCSANWVEWRPESFAGNCICDNLATQVDRPEVPRVKFARGFIDSITTDWATWLRHHPAMFYHPSQRVPCDECGGSGSRDSGGTNPFGIPVDMPCGCESGTIQRPFTREVLCEGCYGQESHSGAGHANFKMSECPSCSGTGRITVSLADTVQPLTRLRLTTWPIADSVANLAAASNTFFATDGSGAEFVRAKCKTCDGKPYPFPITDGDTSTNCPTCHSTPLNEWHCETWPGLTIEMPEAERGLPPMYDGYRAFLEAHSVRPI